ncbi:MAG: MarR family transcriptional regulator [Acidimicrobiia bacterium]
MTTTAPPLTGQDIGTVAAATSRVFDVLLARNGVTFGGWLVMNALDQHGGPLSEAELTRRLLPSPGEPSAAVAMRILAATGLVTLAQPEDGDDGPVATLTEAGAARVAAIRAGIREVAGRLYGDIPADDLATARRVLATITERANAELGL